MRPLLRFRLGPKPNEGARLLWAALRKRGMSQKEADAVLKAASGVTSRLLYCDRRPGRELAGRIATAFGIPATRWDEEPKRPIDLEANRPRTGTDG